MKPLSLIPLFAVATVLAAESAAPELELRLNGHATAPELLAIGRGEPVIAEVVLRTAAPASSPPISLDPPEGSWAARVKIVVKGDGGTPAAWPFVIVGKPSAGALALQPEALTTLVLRLDSAAAPPAAPGRYHLSARLDLTDGRGWRGVVESKPIDVELADISPATDGDTLGRRQLFRVRDALLAGDMPRAEAAADEILRADFMRPEGHVALALIAEAKGERRLALICVGSSRVDLQACKLEYSIVSPK